MDGCCVTPSPLAGEGWGEGDEFVFGFPPWLLGSARTPIGNASRSFGRSVVFGASPYPKPITKGGRATDAECGSLDHQLGEGWLLPFAAVLARPRTAQARPLPAG